MTRELRACAFRATGRASEAVRTEEVTTEEVSS